MALNCLGIRKRDARVYRSNLPANAFEDRVRAHCAPRQDSSWASSRKCMGKIYFGPRWFLQTTILSVADNSYDFKVGIARPVGQGFEVAESDFLPGGDFLFEVLARKCLVNHSNVASRVDIARRYQPASQQVSFQRL